MIAAFAVTLTFISPVHSNYENYNCVECYNAMNGMYCLNDNDFQQGLCCDGGLAREKRSIKCLKSENNRFCMMQSNGNEKAKTIKNGHISEFACPLSRNNCPWSMDDVKIKLQQYDKFYQREFYWNRPVPTDAAKQWYCKYLIETDPVLINSKGVILVQIEPYFFDEEVFLILQPHGEYNDWDGKSTDNVQVIKV